jgi:hypothetical protein
LATHGRKWFMIPALAGLTDKLDASKPPHQAIKQICELRNKLMHVNFSLFGNLPSPETALSYFRYFVEAMEDLTSAFNVAAAQSRSPRC